MSYFSKFPKTFFTLNNSETFVLADILRRVTLSDKFTRNSVVLEDYFVLDGETPEMVSNKIYGNPTYHWLILMVNEIVDYRNEWPIKDSNVVDLVYQKYDFDLTVPDESEYSENDVVTSSAGGEFLVSKTETGKVFLRSQNGKTTLAISDTLNNTTTSTSGLTISAVTDPEEGVHHYYDTVLELIVDSGYSVNTISVSNYEHESTVNDGKRTVKVLAPRFTQQVVKEFSRLVKL